MAVLGVALLGAGEISRTYAEALARISDARLIAVASRTQASADALAASFDVELALEWSDLAALWSRKDVDVVCVNSPNSLHAEHALAALRAGKHVVVEKPLCFTLDEADQMIAAAKQAKRGLAYAENLCFAPHYRRAKELLDLGAIGQVLYARQFEKHGGPYSDWFWHAETAGGGALLDMGCHSIECLRWLMGKPPIRRVTAQIQTRIHGERTDLDDEALVTLELEGGAALVSESSWCVQTGMQSLLEVHGSEGTLQVDLLGSTGLQLNRENQGWHSILPDPLESNGYCAQLEHFFQCFRDDKTPETSGSDGRAVLEIMLAAYRSAREGCAIELPFDPGPFRRPIDLWRP